MRAPRIAIPEIMQDVTNYVYALRFLGAEPVVVTTIDATQELGYLQVGGFRVKEFDGLLLPGGGDVNPLRYGQQIQGSLGIRDDLDALQLLLLDSFVSHEKPVFGICRGHQLINVYFGGSLIQNLPTYERHDRPEPKAMNPDQVHGCIVREGSWLEALYGSAFQINSCHHQGVDRAGTGLIIDAWSMEDGVVEAMHHESLPVWSVQFHPERMQFSYYQPDTVSGAPVLAHFLKSLLTN